MWPATKQAYLLKVSWDKPGSFWVWNREDVPKELSGAPQEIP